MSTEGITFRYDPPRGPPRRVRYEPRTPDGYDRITEEWTGCKWRIEGREPVTDVALEVGAEAAGVLDVIEAAGQSVTGPEAGDR